MFFQEVGHCREGMIPSQVHKTFYVVYTFKCSIVFEREAFWNENWIQDFQHEQWTVLFKKKQSNFPLVIRTPSSAQTVS